MAEVAIALAAVIDVEQFSGVPGGGIYPRARLTARFSGSVAAKIASNTQHVTVTVTLPPNFAYVQDTSFFSLRSATVPSDVDHYINYGYFRVSRDGSETTTIGNLVAPGLARFGDVGDGLKIWTIPQKFTDLIYNQTGGTPNVTYVLQDTEATDDTVVLTAAFNASFLVYDIMQATEVIVNAPQPVSIR